jgi:hypothetical protein
LLSTEALPLPQLAAASVHFPRTRGTPAGCEVLVIISWLADLEFSLQAPDLIRRCTAWFPMDRWSIKILSEAVFISWEDFIF